MILNEYWKTKLDNNQAQLYNRMLVAFRAQNEEVSCGNLLPNDIVKVYTALMNDHPELYNIAHNPRLTQSVGLFSKNSILSFQNIYARNLIRKYDKALETLKNEIKIHIGALSDDYSKEKAVCDFIIENTTYEINDQYNQNAVAVLLEHKGQCSGIARAVKLMLGWVGIESLVVFGDAVDKSRGMQGPHSWNIVSINGECHHLDVTFMLGANMNKTKPFRHLYLNYSDEEIQAEHSWDYKSTPKCTKHLDAEAAYNTNIFNSPASDNVIASLYELRLKLKKAVSSGQHGFSFTSAIAVRDDKLLDYVSGCCKDVINQVGKDIKMSIVMQGKLVVISW